MTGSGPGSFAGFAVLSAALTAAGACAGAGGARPVAAQAAPASTREDPETRAVTLVVEGMFCEG